MRRTLTLLLCLSALLSAQEFRATLTGHVVDPAGAAIANATVHVRNQETNENTPAVTDSRGSFTAPLLRPGTYSISIEVAGFKKFIRDGLVLNVGQTASLNIALEVGNVTEQVTVTAEAPLLETATADRGSVIDQQRVHEFPLNARNPFMLATLVAGVNFNGNVIYQRPFDNGAIADWSINGSATRNNEFLLDGAPNNAQSGDNNIAYVPPVDSVQEFKIHTNSYDAQYGHTGGGIINVSLKSGTNQLHGSVYEFARRNAWDANSFQNNARGAEKEGHFLDQYGVQMGGPIYIPKLYNGRDKSFFMFNYEGYREGTPNPLNLSVPEMEMRDGDFSKLTDAQGRAITIYDPTTGRSVKGAWTRDPFPGNSIPASRINPIARRILDFYPKPNTVTPGVGYSASNYFVPGGKNIARDSFYNLVFKFDQNFGERHRMFFRNASNDRSEMRNTNGVFGPGETGPLPQKRINDAYVLDWVGTVTPTFLVNVRASASRFVASNHTRNNEGFDMTTLGFPSSLARQLPYGDYFGAYDITGYLSMGGYVSGNNTNTVTLHPNLTKIKGAHTIKSGVDMRWVQYVTINTGDVFNLSADKSYTRKDYARGDALSGNGIATWLLGTPTGGHVAYNTLPIIMNKYYAPWVQEDWKATRRLTLNLGLRWDFNLPSNERYNRLTRGFDPAAPNPVDGMVDRTAFPNLPALQGALLFAGVNGVPRAAADTYYGALQPRAGAAYQVTDKLVVRGGWGRYYMNPDNSYLQTTGFNQSTPYIGTLDGGRTILPNVMNNPFPGGVMLPQGSALGALTFVGRGFNFFQPDFKLPYVNQFSAGVQYQLPLNSKLDVSYVGSRSRDLQSTHSYNDYSLALRTACNPMEGGSPSFCDERVPNPFKGLAPFEGTAQYSADTVARTLMDRPMPQFGALTQLGRNDGAMWYNSMQVNFETRTRGGLNLIANYTLSKHIVRDGYNDALRDVMQQGLFDSDRPHRISIGSVYQLPVGRGKRFLNTSNPVWSRLLSGWQNTVMLIWQSGVPWTLANNVIYVKEAKIANIDWSAPQVQGVTPCVARWNDDNTITMQPYSVQAGCTEYNFLEKPRFTPSFVPNSDGRLRLHTVPQADISLNKTTRITEKTSVQFRAEAFNVTNTYMYYRANFTNDPENANFGKITKATVGVANSNRPRYIQLAVKLVW